ncbi:hypothetical protein T484DRAFT_1773371, partial [Baffinella frigidus]
MKEVGRLEFLPDEERLWSLVAEPLDDATADSWFAYAGVGNPAGRLVKVDLLQMKRVGYLQLSGKDVRGGISLGSFAYFVTSAKPAVVMRCPIKEMFHGDTFHPLEVSLALGEHNVQAVFADNTNEHMLLGTYTQPARVVKLAVPAMTRSASLLLPANGVMAPRNEHVLLGTYTQPARVVKLAVPAMTRSASLLLPLAHPEGHDIGDEMIYCGARWDKHAIFGTSTLPGRIIKVHIETLTHIKTIELSHGEDRAVSLV